MDRDPAKAANPSLARKKRTKRYRRPRRRRGPSRARASTSAAEAPLTNGSRAFSTGTNNGTNEAVVLDLAALHAEREAREEFGRLKRLPPGKWEDRANRATTRVLVACAVGNWNAAISEGQDAIRAVSAVPKRDAEYGGDFVTIRLHRRIYPCLARAHAAMKDFHRAHQLIDGTEEATRDCYRCLLARAFVAAREGKHDVAERFFRQAVDTAPAIATAYLEWGEAILYRKPSDQQDPAAAIEKFDAANQLQPKYADPLERWGEALVKLGHFSQAIAKFEEANKYARCWGRLHLMWGRALALAGDDGASEKHLALASLLGLTKEEWGELARRRPARLRIGLHDDMQAQRCLYLPERPPARRAR